MLASNSALTGSLFSDSAPVLTLPRGGELIGFFRAPARERIDSKRFSRYQASSLHKSESPLPRFAVNPSTQRSLARFQVFHNCGKTVYGSVSLMFL